ncbi:MAG TPA: hypothetical protein V6C98_08555 [Thermosynechococcaceae cyanobacterium]
MATSTADGTSEPVVRSSSAFIQRSLLPNSCALAITIRYNATATQHFGIASAWHDQELPAPTLGSPFYAVDEIIRCSTLPLFDDR